MSPKDADVIANSEDPDLIRVCTVCSDLFFKKLMIITVNPYFLQMQETKGPISCPADHSKHHENKSV